MAYLHTKKYQKLLKYFQHSLMKQRKFIEIEQDNYDGKNCHPKIMLLLSTIGII